MPNPERFPQFIKEGFESNIKKGSQVIRQIKDKRGKVKDTKYYETTGKDKDNKLRELTRLPPGRLDKALKL